MFLEIKGMHLTGSLSSTVPKEGKIFLKLPVNHLGFVNSLTTETGTRIV